MLYPALPDAPGHAIWKRDFSGATGLMGISFVDRPPEAAVKFVNSLSLFGIGASWGGFESLVTLPKLDTIRTARPWPANETVVRLHIGLEDPADLIEDLDQALAASGLAG